MASEKPKHTRKAQREAREDAIDSAIARKRLAKIRRNPKRLVTGAAAKKALAEMIGKPKRRAKAQGKAPTRAGQVKSLAKYLYDSCEWQRHGATTAGYYGHLADAALRWFAEKKVKHD